MGFISANSNILLSVYIFKGKPTNLEESAENSTQKQLLEVNFALPEPTKHATRSTYPQFFAWTLLGYSNNELHYEIMMKFAEIWEL